MKPVCEPSFWQERIYRAFALGKDLHTCIYDVDYSVWLRIQNDTAGVLQRHLTMGDELLDVCCGYGAVYDVVPPGVKYAGFDVSPDLLRLGKIRNPDANLVEFDIRTLQPTVKRVPYAITRGVQYMVEEQLGKAEWLLWKDRIAGVAERLIIMQYEDVSAYTIEDL